MYETSSSEFLPQMKGVVAEELGAQPHEASQDSNFSFVQASVHIVPISVISRLTLLFLCM
jgi:hypothetical protein